MAVLEANISFFSHLHTISSMKSIGRLSITTEVGRSKVSKQLPNLIPALGMECE